MGNMTQGPLEYIDEDGKSTLYRIATADGPIERTLLASAARTTTQTSPDLTNPSCTGIRVTLDATVNAGSVTVTINAKDSASGKYVLLLAGAAVTGVSTNVYVVSPFIAASANAIAQTYVTPIFQIVVTANNAGSATYSVGYVLLP